MFIRSIDTRKLLKLYFFKLSNIFKIRVFLFTGIKGLGKTSVKGLILIPWPPAITKIRFQKVLLSFLDEYSSKLLVLFFYLKQNKHVFIFIKK